MNRIALLAALAGAAIGIAAQAAPVQTVDLDGSVDTHATAKGATLAASASRALNKADVPSQKASPADLAAAADADLDRRDSHPVTPRLKAERQNLKGADAAHALVQQQNPSTYDRSISMGDKDHTEQVTNLKVFLQK